MKRLSPVLGWACLLASAPLLAAPIGNLRSIAAGSGQQWDLVTDTGAVVQLSLPRADVVRIWAAPKGAGLTGAGDKSGPRRRVPG
jgi:alpha-glucosidase